MRKSKPVSFVMHTQMEIIKALFACLKFCTYCKPWMAFIVHKLTKMHSNAPFKLP